MTVIDFNDFKKSLHEPVYTSKPSSKVNLYKKNLAEKIKYFNDSISLFLDNPIIEQCNFSVQGCAIRFTQINSPLNITLVLHDYSPDEEDLEFVTWEFYVRNFENDEYLDSKFFTTSKFAIKYFILKIKYFL